MIQYAKPREDGVTLFPYEEQMLDLAETMLHSLDDVPDGLPEGFKTLRDAYRQSYREARRLLRISDRLQLDLHDANRRLSEQTVQLQALNDKLHQEIQRRKTLEQELRRLATIDELTDISNRRHVLELGEHEVRRHRRSQKPLSLMLCDLDHFKEINDRHGHAVGDDALRFFAQLFRAELREGDIAGRLGGEEFLAILPQTDLDEAMLVAERLRARLAASPIPGSQANPQGPIKLSLSIGVAALTKDTPLNRAIARADHALYRAKHHGRNQVVADSPDFPCPLEASH
ncbi:Stalked cell differentiation-controlling protein [Thiorhodovibrio winogradskyi]|uniref:diguanylate cyclase n=1 Tax=Thiorhodovibrio winogradskyi TaxID=77007 RepID=A0ABZ0SAB8_9GAMM|nr:GGDEF domain-containing protein [Thiorhodovibrio winogradskyi]